MFDWIKLQGFIRLVGEYDAIPIISDDGEQSLKLLY